MKEEVATRAALLRLAEQLVTGDRNQTHGPPTQNFTNIADLLNIQFRHKLKEGEEFTSVDVAIMMVQVKLARIIAQPKYDNFLDIAGYIACAAECQEVLEKLLYPLVEVNGKIQEAPAGQAQGNQ